MELARMLVQRIHAHVAYLLDMTLLEHFFTCGGYVLRPSIILGVTYNTPNQSRIL